MGLPKKVEEDFLERHGVSIRDAVDCCGDLQLPLGRSCSSEDRSYEGPPKYASGNEADENIKKILRSW